MGLWSNRRLRYDRFAATRVGAFQVTLVFTLRPPAVAVAGVTIEIVVVATCFLPCSFVGPSFLFQAFLLVLFDM